LNQNFELKFLADEENLNRSDFFHQGIDSKMGPREVGLGGSQWTQNGV